MLLSWLDDKGATRVQQCEGLHRILAQLARPRNLDATMCVPASAHSHDQLSLANGRGQVESESVEKQQEPGASEESLVAIHSIHSTPSHTQIGNRAVLSHHIPALALLPESARTLNGFVSVWNICV